MAPRCRGDVARNLALIGLPDEHRCNRHYFTPRSRNSPIDVVCVCVSGLNWMSIGCRLWRWSMASSAQYLRFMVLVEGVDVWAPPVAKLEDRLQRGKESAGIAVEQAPPIREPQVLGASLAGASGLVGARTCVAHTTIHVKWPLGYMRFLRAISTNPKDADSAAEEILECLEMPHPRSPRELLSQQEQARGSHHEGPGFRPGGSSSVVCGSWCEPCLREGRLPLYLPLRGVRALRRRAVEERRLEEPGGTRWAARRAARPRVA